jgi:hypothetical protein
LILSERISKFPGKNKTVKNKDNSIIHYKNRDKRCQRRLTNDSDEATVNDITFLKWNVLSLEDLITSKIKANRAKDLRDVQ